VQLLRDCPGYRLLFASRSVSLLGDWFSMIAIVALLRELVGSDATALSGVLILRLLPIFLAGPVAGVVADRFSRRAVMIASDLLRLALVLGLFAAPWIPEPVPFIGALVFLQVTASAFFEPARSATLPRLVPDRYLATANALGAIVWSVAFALGAALGGIVTDLLGWRAALGVDAATYAVSAYLVSRIRLPRLPPRESGPLDWQSLTGLRDFRSGLRFIVRRRDVATVIFLKTGWGIAGAITLFLTLFGERHYALAGRPDLGVALLYMARAVGTAIGPMLARHFVTDEGPRAMRLLLGGAMLWPLGWYLLFSWVRDPVSATLCVVLAHFGGSVLWVYSTVLLQRMVPDEFLGRVMSTDLGLTTLTISASIWFYGLLADAPGADLRQLVRVMALSLLLPAGIWFVAAGRWPVGRSARASSAPP
jgi:MFS family permease